LQKINDILVWMRLKHRVGNIVSAEILDVSFVEGGGICTRSEVSEIKYEYHWKNPFKNIGNAKKREVPFEKHTNPDCRHGGLKCK